jgi:hypothetical protein
MAYDPARARTVLFGGLDNSTSVVYFGDTWEWDGQDWQQRQPVHAPPARCGHGMAFDPNGGGILLFGGGGGTLFDDTWRWDGADWQQLQPPTMPFLRTYLAMATDTHRRRVVLLGDYTTSDPYLWEWDGAAWDQRRINSPSPRKTPCLVYDKARRQITMFGGLALSTIALRDTWVYRTDSPADYVPFGHGCAGSVGTPLLANAPYRLPWLGDSFTAEVRQLPASAAMLLMTGFYAPPPVSLAPFGMPGCDWFVSNDLPVFLFADASGTASWSIAVPNLPASVGVVLFQQAFVLDAVNTAGAVTSNAAELRTGVR